MGRVTAEDDEEVLKEFGGARARQILKELRE
jgi:hypothetical protein